MNDLFVMLIFPGGLFLLLNALVYDWIDRKMVARLQNRIGPRWFQPGADIMKLLVKEEILPEGVNKWLFIGLPMIAFAGTMTAALYVPTAGLVSAYGFRGDLIVTFYLLSLMTLCIALAGMNTRDQFSIMGTTRTLTQLFAYEAPFLLALLGPAFVVGSWQINEIAGANGQQWMLFLQPIGFLVALISLMGKLELPPFDAPEAETEIVAGSLTEYSGRGLALFMLGKKVELVVGLTLIAVLYMGGLYNPLDYLLKTLLLLFVVIVLQALLTRFRIDQTVKLWWRYGVILVLVQWFIVGVLYV